MTDQDLKSRLAALRTPAPDPAAAGRALHRATIALRSADDTVNPSRLRGLPWRLSAFVTLAAACVALLLTLRTPTTPSPTLPAFSEGDLKLLAQLDQVFPGRVNAVIIRDGATELDLAERAPAVNASDQAVVIELSRDDQRLRVLSYSGRDVSLRLAAGTLDFSPLLTADGQVVLAGADFVWSTSAPGNFAGWSIRAHPLSTL